MHRGTKESSGTGAHFPSPSAFDRGRVEGRAVGVMGEKRGERDRGLGGEYQLGKALLAETIVEPPLKGTQFALRHPVGRPGRVGELRARRLGQVGQVLQADAPGPFAGCAELRK